MRARTAALLALGGLLPICGAIQAAGQLSAGAVAPPGQRTSATRQVDASAAADGVIQRTNAFRQRQGLDALERDANLAAAAQDFADFMARTDRYGHEADGKDPSERAEQHGYAYCVVAENIAYQYRSTGFTSHALARALVEGWEGSPPHRRNMLERAVTDIGAAVAHSDKTGRWYGVQMFGLPKSARTTFSVTNASETPVRYRLGDRSFDLPPRVTRTHKQCRPAQLRFDWPADEPTTVEPRSNGHYVVSRDAGGAWQLRRE